MFSFISLFSSCSSLNVMDIYKEKHIPGVPSGDNYLLYVFEFKTSDTLVMNSINLYSGNKEILIDSYALTNLENFSGQTLRNEDQMIENGNYRVSFRVEPDTDFLTDQELSIIYTVNDKLKMIRKKIKIHKKVVTKR